jgi:hypothetical protein
LHRANLVMHVERECQHVSSCTTPVAVGRSCCTRLQ